jgi:hypothetical protein
VTPRKGISKRRWKARAQAGRWLPTIVVFIIDPSPAPLTERWAQHPTEPDFWKLKTAPGSSANTLPQLTEVAEVGL